MAMNIDLKTAGDFIEVPNGDVTIEFIDNSGCHVDVIFVMQGEKVTSINFDDPKSSSFMKTYTLKSGKHPACMVSLYGYSYKTLNRSYATEMKINGTSVLTAKGTLDKDPGFDTGTVRFSLNVT